MVWREFELRLRNVQADDRTLSSVGIRDSGRFAQLRRMNSKPLLIDA
jgi:hypothetical protein